MSEKTEGALSVTALLKRTDPAWWWLRENFKLPSLLAIAGLLASSGAWIYTQHADLVQLKGQGPKLEAIGDQLSKLLESQSALRQQLNDFGERIDRQERKWERVEAAAEIRVPRRRGER